MIKLLFLGFVIIILALYVKYKKENKKEVRSLKINPKEEKCCANEFILQINSNLKNYLDNKIRNYSKYLISENMKKQIEGINEIRMDYLFSPEINIKNDILSEFKKKININLLSKNIPKTFVIELDSFGSETVSENEEQKWYCQGEIELVIEKLNEIEYKFYIKNIPEFMIVKVPIGTKIQFVTKEKKKELTKEEKERILNYDLTACLNNLLDD